MSEQQRGTPALQGAPGLPILVPMASCAHVPHPKIRDIDLHRPMAWFPGAYDLRALLWAHVRVWGARWQLPHATAEVDILPAAGKFI